MVYAMHDRTGNKRLLINDVILTLAAGAGCIPRKNSPISFHNGEAVAPTLAANGKLTRPLRRMRAIGNDRGTPSIL
ncbi:MAG: hypothetical protein ACJ8G3_10690 [Burkholderiaceae bacterium]